MASSSLPRSSLSTIVRRAASGLRIQTPRRGIVQTETISGYSSPLVRDALWYSADFRFAAGLIIIQPSSGKVVVVHDTATGAWFLPRGRKDVGETIEQTALREGYEESGYRAEFLPLCMPSLAPVPPGVQDDGLRTGEPLFVRVIGRGALVEKNTQNLYRAGDEYICHYFVGQIPADAVRETGTTMADETSYVGELLTIEEAFAKISDKDEKYIMHIAYNTWKYTTDVQRRAQTRPLGSGSRREQLDGA